MTKVIHGVVHGKIIELIEDLGMSDGQEVELSGRAVSERTERGEAIRRSAGALADDPHWDAIMDEIQQARKQERRPQMEAE